MVDVIANIIIALAVVGLLAASGYMVWKNRPGVGTVLSFAFLFAVLLVAARFKHFKGFGFEAETWDQKQIEIAELADRLTPLTVSTAQQLGLVAASLGLMDSGFTNPQLMRLLSQVNQMLDGSGINRAKREEIISPITERIKKNYVFAARHLAERDYQQAIDRIDKSISSNPPENRDVLLVKREQLKKAQEEVTKFLPENGLVLSSLSPIVNVVNGSVDFEGKDDLVKSLNEFNDDYLFFVDNQQLRRNIDVNYVYER